MKKNITKAIKLTASIITTAVLAIALGSIILQYAIGIKPFIVVSASMTPSIKVGSTVFINTHDTEPEIGDVIAYTNTSNSGSEITVIHRVKEINDNGTYTTQGDANEAADLKAVYPAQVVGTCINSISNLGYIMAFVNQYRILIIGGIVIINIISISLPEEKSEKN